MAILRQSPFRQLRKLERQLDDLVGGSDGETNDRNAGLTRWSPRVDVYEEGNDLVFQLDVPGINKDNLDVSVDNNQLVISGERREEKDVEDKNRNYFRSERVYGTFQRSFALPETVDADQIDASYDDGVLKIRAPRTEQATSQQVQIE